MTTAYSLATIRHDGRPTPVMEVGGHYWLLDGVAPGLIDKASGSGLIKLFDDWPVSHAKLSAIAQTLQGSASELRSPKGAGDFYAPLLYPAKLIMMGANYADHVGKDVGIQGFNKVANIPTLFMKQPIRR
jgi:hypothetical protein